MSNEYFFLTRYLNQTVGRWIHNDIIAEPLAHTAGGFLFFHPERLLGRCLMKRQTIIGLAVSLIILITALNPESPITRAQNGCNGPHCVYFPNIVYSQALEVYADITCYRQSPYVIVGDVLNVTNNTVYNAKLSAKLHDQNGHLYGTYSDTTALVATFAGKTNPFSIYTDVGFECNDNIGEFDVSVDSWSMFNPVEYRPVTILSIVLTGSGWQTEISGEIRNDQVETLSNIKILIQPGSNSLYQFADVDKTSLAPGEITAYSSSIYHPWEPPLTYAEVQGQGKIVP